MAVEILKKSFTVSISGGSTSDDPIADWISTNEECSTIVLPIGTVLQILSGDCSAGDEIDVRDLSGGTIFHSFAQGDVWNDRMTLNRVVKGLTVPTLDAGILYFFLPSGRL